MARAIESFGRIARVPVHGPAILARMETFVEGVELARDVDHAVATSDQIVTTGSEAGDFEEIVATVAQVAG